MQLPSASNSAGTLLGALAGAATAAALPSIPFIITAAAAVGMTPVGLASVAAIAVTALVNYGVTHYGELSDLNGKVAAFWPQIQPLYPAGKNGQTGMSPISNQPWNSKAPGAGNGD